MLALLGLLAVPHVQAGQRCEDTALTPATLQSAMSTAQRVTAELDRRGIQVAVLGRVGQDLSKYGLKYSHAGFVYRESPAAPWQIAHLLNTCGTSNSDLWYEGVGNFFLDDMFSYDALVIVPPPATAQALLARLPQGNVLRSMHDKDYSLVAYPFSTRYQNSNTWVLETLAAASARDATLGNREQAQAWLKMAGYQPSEMELGTFTRLGGRMFKANVAFNDHPNELRYAGRIRTVTVESIKRFLMSRNEGWTVFEIPARP
ncbi:hypothetical protein AWB76_03056 [Caballeronia temeraria]|uniref:DUF2145 domain-containing protein n=1 Tax=Caballeronia temeraria TaxID=1777137 RepID=A0A158AUH2_9BURK|nr:DUF2145 domain-containing protein [Caballeronia temeraria]SAK61504.1 hypothetical protein AWB76_03056 [Caballeronia temeraria]